MGKKKGKRVLIDCGLIGGFGIDIMSDNYKYKVWSNKSEESNTINEKSKKKKGEKKKEAREALSENLMHKAEKSGNLIGKLIEDSHDIVVVDGELWLYDEDLGCYCAWGYDDFAKLAYGNLSCNEKLKVSTKDLREGFELLKISGEVVDEDVFFENAPFVNCLNGVVDVLEGDLLEHSQKYYFKNCIGANFVPGAKCEKFLDYLDYVTDGDKELKKLLRGIMGYIFSHYNNAKTAFLIYGVPHTGKSVLCNLIERIAGKENSAHVDISMLNRQEYVASLRGKILNVAPDLKNERLKDVGFF